MKILTLLLMGICTIDALYSIYFNTPLNLFNLGSVYILGGFTLRLLNQLNQLQKRL